VDLSLNGLLESDKTKRDQNLFKSFGMDANGNNEVGAWARRLAQVLGYNSASRVAYMNSLEPQRQAQISSYIQSLQPENIYSNAEAYRNRATTGGMDQGQALAALMAQQGLGAGAQAGAMLKAQNQATQSGNSYLTNAMSAQGRQNAMQAVQQGYNLSRDMGLNELYETGGFIENRSRQNLADKSQGGLMGSLGSLVGMVPSAAWSSIF